MSRISPLHHIHQATSAQFVERGGWLIPHSSTASSVEAISIFDCSWDGKLQVEGAEAADVIKRAFGMALSQNGEVVHTQDGVIIGRITAHRYLLLAKPDAESSIQKQLANAIAIDFVTITDQSDGQGGICLAGDGAVSLIQTLCALDFDRQYFPINTVKISSFAKVRATIWHLEDGYPIYIGRSFTEYVWDAVHKALHNLSV